MKIILQIKLQMRLSTIRTFAYGSITYSIFSPEIINIKLIKTSKCKIEQTLRNMCFTTNLQIASPSSGRSN